MDPLLDTPQFQASVRRVKNVKLPEFLPGVPVEAIAIVHDYTVGSRWLNEELWQDVPSDKAVAYRDALNEALDQMPIYGEPVVHFDARSHEEVKSLALSAGQEIEWKGFLSCTKTNDPPPPAHRYQNRVVKWVVVSRTGRDVEQLSLYGPRFGKQNQYEVLFKAGTTFRYLESEEDEHYLTLYIEEI